MIFIWLDSVAIRLYIDTKINLIHNKIFISHGNCTVFFSEFIINYIASVIILDLNTLRKMTSVYIVHIIVQIIVQIIK